MQTVYFLAALTALVNSSPVPGTDSSSNSLNTVVDLGYVSYRGITNTTLNITSWNGIRFAASPEGELRWQPPVDIEKRNNYSSNQVIDATQLGPSCFQASTPGLSQNLLMPDAEDCLLLNVHVPVSPVSPKLPVMVVIHGGGYNHGNAQDEPGSYLVSRSRGNLVYIEIQYRLGGFGFLGGSEVNNNGSANVGFLDQRSALQWIQRHVSSFGGDPSKVTITGGSAGGGTVTAQLALMGDDPNPPFRAAIPEYTWWQTYHNATFAEDQYKLLLQTSQCPNLACLRALSFDQLAHAINQTYITAYAAGAYGHADFYYTPYVDGKVVRELPTQAFAGGRFTRVPLLTDHDALEGLIFTNTSTFSDASVHQQLRQLWPASTDAFISGIDKYYPASAFSGSAYFNSSVISKIAPNTTLGEELDAGMPGLAADFNDANPYFFKLQQIIGDAFVGCGTRFVAENLQKYDVPVWKAVWNTGELIHDSIDIALLGPPSQEASPAGYGDILKAYFISFAIGLDPNNATAFADVERPFWPVYGVNATVLDLNATTIATVGDADDSERCNFLFNNTQILRI